MGLKKSVEYFGKAFSELLAPTTYRGGSAVGQSIAGSPQKKNVPTDIMMFGGDGVGAFFSFDGINSCLQAYERCAPLMAVCNKRAKAFTNGRLSITNSMGKPSTSSQSKRVLKLLQNPNPLQTTAAFLAQIFTYIDLVEYAVVVPLRPVGFDMNEAESLWVIPPTLTSLHNSGGNLLNFQNGGIDAVQVGNVWVKPEDVMIITGINPSLKHMVIPGQKIKSLELVINNVIGAYESESTLIYHRGPSTLISSEMSPTTGGPFPISDEEKEQIHSSFFNSYGFTRGQTHTVITSAAVKVHKMGFNADELKLHDTIKNGTIAICDTLGYPTSLMGIVDPTYNNIETANKEVYTKFIGPDAINIAQQIGSYLLPTTDKLNIDYSHVPELQKDKQKEAQARKTMGEALEREFRLNLITYNRMLTLLGEEPREGFDRYYYELKDEIDFVFDKSNAATNDKQPNNENSNNV